MEEEKKYLDYQGLQTYHENLLSVLDNSELATAEALDNLDDRLKTIENKSPYSKSEIDDLLDPITDKLDNIEEFAEVNVLSDWNETNSNSDAYIKNKPTIPAAVTESTVSRWGFTKNAGTVTGIKMNGASKGSSGVVDLGTVITAHQDISGKVNTSTKVNGHALTGDVTVSKTDVGLGNVTNDSQVKRSEMGVASGVATLDTAGKVPSSQLPSYVDDVLEYDTKSAFPATGEAGKIYVDKSNNTTWRWSGTAYSQIKGDLVIGTTSGTAADGKVVNDHINSKSNPHSVTKAQVGLGSVVNTGDSATPVANGTTKFTTGGAYTELAKKVDKVTGKGLSANDYTDADKTKLDGIASGAEVNQNAFSNVAVGNTTISADGKTDTLTLVAGSNVTITPDATNDKVTIAATDTTYSAATTSAAGLMSADDKTKLNGIATGATKVTTDTVAGWGYTKNAGTVTGVKINGTTKSPSSGIVDLGTVITSHQDISGKLNKSGDIMTGDLTRKCTNVDASKANNNISSTIYPTTYNVIDNSNRILTRKEAIIEPNGNISAYWYVRNYNTSGTMVGQKGIQIKMNKSGNVTYTVDEAAKFRSAIGAGTSSFSGSYNDLSNKPTIPAEVTESTVSGWGFTKNTGTIIGIKMNGASKGTSGVVDLGTVITAHQDISGKVDKTTTVNGHALSGNVSVTKSDVGLGNVGNFKAVSTVALQGLTDTEKSNARANIGAGTSSFSGSYNDLSNKPTIPAAAKNGTYTVKTLVGNTTTNVSDFTANQSTADDVTFVQGSNVTITPDATNRKITIAAKDTTYSSKAAASGGTDVSLVTTGEKYTWNSKTSNTGTVTSVAVKMNGSTKGTVTTSGTIDLGTVITSHQDISGKADKSATVSTVSYDTTNKKITKTVNGVTSDVVTAAKIVGDGAKENVKISLTQIGGNAADLIGATVTITDDDTSETLLTATWNGTSITAGIDANTNYTVSVATVTGYLPCAPQSYQAIQLARTMTFLYRGNGVFLEDTNHQLYTRSGWDSSKTVNGIVIITGTYNYRFSVTYINTDVTYSTKVVEIGNYITYRDPDYQGQLNTDGLVSFEKAKNLYTEGHVGYDVQHFLFPDNKTRAYAPTITQMRIVYNNKTEYAACLSAIGSTYNNGWHTTSTFWDVYNDNCMCWVKMDTFNEANINSVRAMVFIPVSDYE